ncbi:MAG: substrate-binding domain-containing protein [Pseudomonadota bacterium]
MNLLGLGVAVVFALFVTSASAETYENGQVAISGSSTVAPYSMALAGLLPDEITLNVDQSGTSSGISNLCIHKDAPVDIAAASRSIRREEIRRCFDRGINTLTETLLGLDGIVLAQSAKAKPLNLTSKDIYLATARVTPRGGGDCLMVTNRRKTWRDVRADLPNREILVIGPPVTSGTRDMLMTLMITEGARQIPCMRALEAQAPDRFAKALVFRNDDHWVDGGENDDAIAHALVHLKQAVGVFGFAHLGAVDGIAPVAFNGVEPTAKTIGTGEYKATRPLYLYTSGKRLADKPAVGHVLKHFFALDAIGPRGVLTGLGLVTGERVGERTVIDTATGARRTITSSAELDESLSAGLSAAATN